MFAVHCSAVHGGARELNGGLASASTLNGWAGAAGPNERCCIDIAKSFKDAAKSFTGVAKSLLSESMFRPSPA